MPKIKQVLEEFRPDGRLIDERGPTNERLKKAEGQVHRDDLGREYFRDSPLNTALSRKSITAGQYSAGQKYYNHWFRAGIIGTMGQSDLARIFGTGGEMSDESACRHAFHRMRLAEADKCLGNLRHWAVEQIICRERSFAEAGMDLGHKNRTRASDCMLKLLRQSLDILKEKWGIIE